MYDVLKGILARSLNDFLEKLKKKKTLFFMEILEPEGIHGGICKVIPWRFCEKTSGKKFHKWEYLKKF